MGTFLNPPFIIAILVALSVHEWAHGYVAYLLGDPLRKWKGDSQSIPSHTSI